MTFVPRGEDFLRRHFNASPPSTPITKPAHRFYTASMILIGDRNQMGNRSAMPSDGHRFAVFDGPQERCQARLGLRGWNFTHVAPSNQSL